MGLKNQLAARVMQVALGRMARPPASALIAGADLPAPEPVVVPTDAGQVRVHLYRPAKAVNGAPPPVYVNLHGGGFIMRHPEYDDHLCRALVAGTGCVVVNVDYDVAPQRPFPVAAQQALGITAWAAREGRSHGWDGDRLAIGGQSAGGNLAAGVCLAARGHGFQPVLQILNYPPLDLATDPSDKTAHSAKPLISPSLARLFNYTYVPDPDARRDPLASPLLADDLTGTTPALVITAEYDLLRDEGDAYAARLAEAGVPVTHRMMQGVDHAYTHLEPTEPLREALSLMVDSLNAAWG